MKTKLLVVFTLLVLFQISSSNLGTSFVGFSEIDWVDTKACTVNHNLPLVDAKKGTYVKHGLKGVCESRPIQLKSRKISLEYFGYPSKQLRVEIKGNGVNQTLSLNDNNSAESEDSDLLDWDKRWRVHRLNLDPELGDQIQFVIHDNIRETKKGILALRARVNFYQGDSLLQTAKSYIQTKKFRILFSFLLALVLVVFAKDLFLYISKLRYESFVVISFLVLTLVHFRAHTFFYWDEWHTLERYLNDGFSSAFMRHNEHRVPLFFLFYYLQALVFQSEYNLYLLINFLIQLVNALLLGAIVKELLHRAKDAELVSRIVVVLYLINALHSESMQWAISQATLLGQIPVYLGVLFSIKYLRTSNRLELLVVALSLAAAPLIFGNGFNLIFLIAAILLLKFFLNHRESSYRGLVLLSGVCFLSLLIPVAFYVLNSAGTGHSANEAKPLSDIPAVINYVFVGSQFASILRGVGLFYSVQQEGAHKLIEAKQGTIFQPEFIFALLGLFLSLVMFFYYYLSNNKKRNLLFWFFGQLLIVIAFILPAIGRYRFGAVQSLALRYETQAIFGFFILFLPLILKTLQGIEKRNLKASLILFIYLFSHLQMSSSYDYFTSRGLRNRDYIEQLTHWEYSLENEKKHLMKPVKPGRLTPGRSEQKILSIVSRLELES